jgi:hypothetical protein
VRVANRRLATVRRLVHNETLGHRGRKADPLYRIRKIDLTGSERVDEQSAEWSCLDDESDQIPSLGKKLKPWRSEILATTTPAPAMDPPRAQRGVKCVKPGGHGLRNFENYRLRPSHARRHQLARPANVTDPNPLSHSNA